MECVVGVFGFMVKLLFTPCCLGSHMMVLLSQQITSLEKVGVAAKMKI